MTAHSLDATDCFMLAGGFCLVTLAIWLAICGRAK